MESIFWGTWDDYPKVEHNGRQYAQVGPRLYTRHAVEYLRPSGRRYRGNDGSPQPLGRAPQNHRSIPPSYVEDVIVRGAKSAPQIHAPTGELRRAHLLGDLQIITTADDEIVITVGVRHA